MNIISKTAQIGLAMKNAVLDGWENLFTGMGGSKDKRTGGRIKYRLFSWQELEDLHDSDEIAHRVVNIIPEEGTLKWLEHKIPSNKELVNKIVDEEERLDIRAKMTRAWSWARLYGGAGIYMSLDDGLNPSEPIDYSKIKKIKTLTVLHKYELSAGRLNDNIDDNNFGKPEFYSVSGANVENGQIHHSRIIIIDGSNVSQNRYINNGYWHDSVLVKLYEVLRDFNLSYGAASSVIQDFNVSILKLKNLADIIGGDDEDLVKSRLRLMNMSKSVLGSILIDAENEDFTNLSTPLTGLDKVLDKIDKRLVTATGMPHTIILGDGATGTLSGKGESEEKLFKGLVAKEQGKVLTSPLDQFYKAMFAQKDGPTKGSEPKDHTWEFCPLFQPSKKETAETRKIVAETDKIYHEIQALGSLDIAKSRFGGDEYSMETSIDIEALEEQIETEKEVSKINKEMDKNEKANDKL